MKVADDVTRDTTATGGPRRQLTAASRDERMNSTRRGGSRQHSIDLPPAWSRRRYEPASTWPTRSTELAAHKAAASVRVHVAVDEHEGRQAAGAGGWAPERCSTQRSGLRARRSRRQMVVGR